jgi:hypothetical protein
VTARVVLHPRAVEWFGLYQLSMQLKDRGYDVDTSLSPRYFVATPEPPPYRPPPSPPTPAPVVQIERRARPFNLWWPKP